MIYQWCKRCGVRTDLCAEPVLHKQEEKHVYVANFYIGGRYGKRTQREFPTKKDAEAYEYTTKADYKRGLYSLDNEIKGRTLFKDFAKEYIDKVVKRYMKGKDSEMYRIDKYIARWKDRPIRTIKHEFGDEYIQECLNNGIKPNSINRELTVLKSMMKWGVENGYIQKNPFMKLRRFKIDDVRVRWLDDNEINLLLRACESLGDYGMKDILTFALNTGFRKGNLVRVTAKDIIGNRIQALKTKTGGTYDVPINGIMQELLPRLITAHKTGPLLDFVNYRRRYDAVVRLAGLWRPDRHPEAVTIHTMRHTFTAQCLRQGIEINMVSKWLDHYSVDFTHKHYGHLCPKREESMINLLKLGDSSPAPASAVIENLKTLE